MNYSIYSVLTRKRAWLAIAIGFKRLMDSSSFEIPLLQFLSESIISGIDLPTEAAMFGGNRLYT